MSDHHEPEPAHATLPRLALSFAVLSLTAGLAPSVAQAQQTLPGIVVQGTALEPPPRRPSKPEPAVAAEEAPPAPAQARNRSTTTRRTSTPAADASASLPAAGPATASADVDASATGGESADASGAVRGFDADRSGSAVSVVTGAELKARQIRNGGEALRSLPGVALNRTGGFAGVTEARIRGADGNHTLVLIDGIEANSGTDGRFDFSDLLVEDIERIEVIRGPQSALYGSSAVGGVINVITKGGRGPLTIAGRAETGSFGTKDVAARVSGGTDRAWGAITVHRQETNGFNIAPDAALGEEDGGRLTSFSAKAGIRPFDGVEINLNARNTSKRLERDDQTGFGADSNRGGFIVASDSLSRQDGNVLLLGANLRWDMLGGALTHVFKATRNITERNDLQIAEFGFGVIPTPFNNTSEVDKLSYQATYRFQTPLLFVARHSITGLVEKERETFLPSFDNAERERGRLAFAGEWRGELFGRLDLSAGARRDDNDSFPDATTWRTSASLRLPEIGLRPHASAGTAVKLPSQFEQFGTAASFVANPALRAEESFGWDAGVEFTLVKGRAVLDVTYFEADLKHKIDSQFASIFDLAPAFACNPGDLFCSRSINLAGISERRGVEVSGRVLLMPGLELGLAYTWLEAADNMGQQELRRPPHTGRADINYSVDGGRGNISAAAVYNGQMKDNAFTWPFFTPVVAKSLDDYWLVTLGASYKLQPGVEIYGRIENALDQKFEEVFGFNTAGIAAYAGVRLTFEDRSNLLASAR